MSGDQQAHLVADLLAPDHLPVPQLEALGTPRALAVRAPTAKHLEDPSRGRGRSAGQRPGIRPPDRRRLLSDGDLEALDRRQRASDVECPKGALLAGPTPRLVADRDLEAATDPLRIHGQLETALLTGNLGIEFRQHLELDLAGIQNDPGRGLVGNRFTGVRLRGVGIGRCRSRGLQHGFGITLRADRGRRRSLGIGGRSPRACLRNLRVGHFGSRSPRLGFEISLRGGRSLRRSIGIRGRAPRGRRRSAGIGRCGNRGRRPGFGIILRRNRSLRRSIAIGGRSPRGRRRSAGGGHCGSRGPRPGFGISLRGGRSLRRSIGIGGRAPRGRRRSARGGRCGNRGRRPGFGIILRRNRSLRRSIGIGGRSPRGRRRSAGGGRRRRILGRGGRSFPVRKRRLPGRRFRFLAGWRRFAFRRFRNGFGLGSAGDLRALVRGRRAPGGAFGGGELADVHDAVEQHRLPEAQVRRSPVRRESGRDPPDLDRSLRLSQREQRRRLRIHAERRKRRPPAAATEQGEPQEDGGARRGADDRGHLAPPRGAEPHRLPDRRRPFRECRARDPRPRRSPRASC